MACGRIEAKRELTRLALDDGRLAVDTAQRLPGRGAYVCGRGCLETAAARGRLTHAFRRPVSIDAQTVESVN